MHVANLNILSRTSIIAAVFLVLTLAGCTKPEGTATVATEERWNVVIVTFDTTRADHFACYGHPSIKTPAVDSLAEDGVLFEHGYTAVPITCPSHATILTGKVPFAHGVRDNGMFVLGEHNDTLAEILKREGYHTAAAVGAFPVASQFGLDQGFDLYDDRLATEYEDVNGDRVLPKEQLFFDERKAGRVNEAAMPWLEKNHKDPFFLWLHYFDPHFPLEPPPPYDTIYAADLYAGEIAYADECLGQVIAKLKELGVYENTIIVFTADHGEGLGEHNESTHSWLVYNSTLHVPFVIRAPGAAQNRRVSAAVGTVDILPTILESLRLPVPETIQGRSLGRFLDPSGDGDAQRKGEPIYAETLSPRLSHGYGELRTLYLDSYKYTYGPKKELYDLRNDHNELNNLIDTKPDIAADMKAKLELYIDANLPDKTSQMVPMNEETSRKLMSLGYLGSSGGTMMGRERLNDEGIAPQDRVIDNSLMSSARQLLYSKKPLQAKAAVLELLERSPDNPTYLGYLADAEAQLGRVDEAYALLNRLVSLPDAQLTTDRRKYLTTMARILIKRKQFAAAIEKLEECQAVSKSADTSYLISLVYKEIKDQNKVLFHLKETLELDEDHVAARVDLAVSYAQAGERNAAEAEFKRALADEPYYAKGYYNYGVFLTEKGASNEAIEALQKAVTLQPGYVLASFSLTKLLLESGRDAEAAIVFQKMREISPTHPMVKLLQELIGK